MDLFLIYGFKSVTMDDISIAMGISKKTIYQHFANKNELVEASTMHLFEFISTGIDRIREEKRNPVEEIFAIRSFLMQHLNNETAAPFHQLQKFFPKISACLKGRHVEKVHGCMTANLQRGVTMGLYRADINIDFISRIYFTGLTGLKDQELFPQELFEINDITKQFLEYHMLAIVTPKGFEDLQKILKLDLTKL